MVREEKEFTIAVPLSEVENLDVGDFDSYMHNRFSEMARGYFDSPNYKVRPYKMFMDVQRQSYICKALCFGGVEDSDA